jgi:hypothetical protein
MRTDQTAITRYRAVDRVIASELALPELAVVRGTNPDWRLLLSATPAPPRPRPFHHWLTAAGERWASFGHDGGRLVLHFTRTAAFVVDEAARAVTCHPIGRARADAIRPVILNQVLPLLFSEERLVLHASAVAASYGAVVFAGAPGMGKSTLATALSLRGLPLLSDDGLVVDQRDRLPCALPAGVEPRLWPDSIEALLPARLHEFPVIGRRTPKRRISASGVCGVPLAKRPAPIAHVFVLSSTEPAGTMRRLSPADAVATLTRYTFVGRIDQPRVVRDTFTRVTALVARVPVFTLGAPRSYQQLDGLCDAICAREPVARCG